MEGLLKWHRCSDKESSTRVTLRPFAVGRLGGYAAQAAAHAVRRRLYRRGRRRCTRSTCKEASCTPRCLDAGAIRASPRLERTAPSVCPSSGPEGRCRVCAVRATEPACREVQAGERGGEGSLPPGGRPGRALVFFPPTSSFLSDQLPPSFPSSRSPAGSLRVGRRGARTRHSARAPSGCADGTRELGTGASSGRAGGSIEAGHLRVARRGACPGGRGPRSRGAGA